MKRLIDKVGTLNLIAAVIVGLLVAGLVLAVTGEFDGDKRPVSEVQHPRPRASARATASPYSFPDAPADDGRPETSGQRYGGQRRSDGGAYYDPYYDPGDDDYNEDYYGYYGYPYEDDADDGTYVTAPPEEQGGSGQAGEPGQPGVPYGGDDDSGAGIGGEGGPGGQGGG